MAKRPDSDNDNDNENNANLPADELEALTQQVRAAFDVRDRRYGFPPKSYPKCFVGNEAVTQMLKLGIAADEEDAERLGNLLLSAGAFRHVLNEHPFRNELLFYRFAADFDRGKVGRRPDGAAVSWADFLTAYTDERTDDHSLNLQPQLPERDSALGSFAQDQLEAIGVAPLDVHNVQLLDHTHPRTWRNPTAKPRYNLVVVGAGAGGLVSSSAAAGLGAEVALVESHLLGGDCLNVGCVPSKALISAARVAALARRGGEYGVKFGAVEVDFGQVMERMRRLRARIAPNDSARRYTDELGVNVFLGRGEFTGNNTLKVDGQTLHFAKAIIATGATAAIPPIPGLKDVPFLTNASVFNLTTLPKRLAVLGAGPIGLELAQAFQRFGSQVTVLCRGQVLPKEDPDAARIVTASLKRDGVKFELCDEIREVRCKAGQPPITVVVGNADGNAAGNAAGKTAGNTMGNTTGNTAGNTAGKKSGERVLHERSLQFDALLIAAGRKPSVTGLGLEAAGVDYDARSGVTVNDRLQTTNPNIYAVGDVASKYQFTHMADFMARIVVRNALFLGRDRVSRLLVPWATYTDPEVAHVGLYESDCRERSIAFTTVMREFADLDRTILEGETEGFVKIHLHQGTDKILGATIVASHAGDMISEISVAMQAGMGLSKLANVIHPYPTAAEAIRQCGDLYNRTRLTPTVKKVFHRLMALQK